MIDKEQIAIMLKDVERYLSIIEDMGISKEDLEEPEKYLALSMAIFQIMNRSIDIGNEIISGSKDIPLPGSYKETFQILHENKILSKETASNMTKLMKFRNAIAHEYYRITPTEMLNLKDDVYDAEDFVSEIKKYLERIK